LALNEVGERGAGKQERPGEVDPNRLFPPRGRVLAKRQRSTYAVVTDEDIKAAKALESSGNRVLGARRRRHIVGR
jgi:hypothetical protein